MSLTWREDKNIIIYCRRKIQGRQFLRQETKCFRRRCVWTDLKGTIKKVKCFFFCPKISFRISAYLLKILQKHGKNTFLGHQFLLFFRQQKNTIAFIFRLLVWWCSKWSSHCPLPFGLPTNVWWHFESRLHSHESHRLLQPRENRVDELISKEAALIRKELSHRVKEIHNIFHQLKILSSNAVIFCSFKTLNFCKGQFPVVLDSPASVSVGVPQTRLPKTGGRHESGFPLVHFLRKYICGFFGGQAKEEKLWRVVYFRLMFLIDIYFYILSEIPLTTSVNLQPFFKGVSLPQITHFWNGKSKTKLVQFKSKNQKATLKTK